MAVVSCGFAFGVFAFDGPADFDFGLVELELCVTGVFELAMDVCAPLGPNPDSLIICSQRVCSELLTQSVGVPGVSEPGIRITFNSELHFVIPN